MGTYRHAVNLDREKCIGCTTCIRHCPTEAIRIVDGQAVINDTRCIDCGQCIRVCPQHAKRPICDKLSSMDRFRWKIALPAPSLYGQFKRLENINFVLNGLKQIGFDQVYEVAAAAELVSAYTRKYLQTPGIKKPAISSACPVVVRLITLRFPSLQDNIVHMLPPMEIAAMLAREQALSEHPELSPEDIGVCFISPCPAKYSYVKNEFGSYKSRVDTVIAVSDLYFLLVNQMCREAAPEPLARAGKYGVSWSTSGGESDALFIDRYLAADGIEHVINILDALENGSIPPLDFVELNACPGGCVGGVMTVENPFVAKARLRNLHHGMRAGKVDAEEYIPTDYFFNDFPEYQPINRLADNMAESMRMMAEVQRFCATLPGLDCGACGAPTCRAFSEDAIRTGANTVCPLTAASHPTDPCAPGGDDR